MERADLYRKLYEQRERERKAAERRYREQEDAERRRRDEEEQRVPPPTNPHPGDRWTNPIDGKAMVWLPPGESS